MNTPLDNYDTFVLGKLLVGYQKALDLAERDSQLFHDFRNRIMEIARELLIRYRAESELLNR